MKLDRSPITSANPSIGRKDNGLNEKLKPNDKVLPISTFATIDIITSSKEAMINEIKDCIRE